MARLPPCCRYRHSRLQLVARAGDCIFIRSSFVVAGNDCSGSGPLHRAARSGTGLSYRRDQGAGDARAGDAAARTTTNNLARVTAEWTALRLATREAGFDRLNAFLADQILTINAFNPLTAARLVPPLGRWRRFDAKRQQLMKAELERLAKTEGLSPDVYELVLKSLAV